MSDNDASISTEGKQMTTDIVEHKTTSAIMLDSSAIESYKDMAQMMAKSNVQVPDHFKGKPADCMAVVLQSAQWRMNPFVVAQKTHVINGTLGYEAQLVNAVVSSSNAIVGRFRYEYQGTREEWKPKMRKESKNGKDVWKPQFSENACVRVGAVIAGESEVTWGEWVYPCDQAVFNSPLWRTNPKQQAGYLAVKFWSRFYTPYVLLGVYTPDEIHESGSIKDINPEPSQVAPASNAMQRLQQATGKNQPEPEPEPENEPIDQLEIIADEFKQLVLECGDMESINSVISEIAYSKSLPDKVKAELREVCKEQLAKIKEFSTGAE